MSCTINIFQASLIKGEYVYFSPSISLSPTTLSVDSNSFVVGASDNNSTLTIISQSKATAFQSFCWVQDYLHSLLEFKAALQKSSPEKVLWKYEAKLQENTHS